MRPFAVILAIVILSCAVSAENISPPSVPEGDEQRLSLVLYDSSTKLRVSDMHARLDVSGEDSFSTMKFVRENGRISLMISPGQYLIEFFLDDIATPGKDYLYASMFDIDSDLEEDVFLVPAGSVQGVVYSGNRAVPGADVLLYCSGQDDPVEADVDFSGTFVVDYLPEGQCRIVAASDENRGETMVRINHGALSEVEVRLDERIVSFDWLYFGFLLIPILLVAIFLLIPKRKNASRSDDVLVALSEREKKVVRHLLDNDNRSTQASIKNDTGIPKTSLLRIFQSLENRNIIYIEKIGKMKKVSLSDWFLGKGKLDRDSASVDRDKP